ncbi:ABC transporter substrate-binding protein [Planomonospora venezuelensis]|uniref:Raffinose/stachyose/melibiose transport system substrate-binding protein n=1 Tax=Planomonospora venezuelensis TaxID=1999 RepID=A0A841D143_PLAVE|nr:extracellular solute-binding protein [Planomonospora venezuelensis]MBB5962234.1 raffinose/stachyose/melibiose transport system substrate-binding protein [Planomonospora venezuelensis]GIN01000.1 sugar ABC transporter substrate-binding protein [Planomonospora venezuelensis]
MSKVRTGIAALAAAAMLTAPAACGSAEPEAGKAAASDGPRVLKLWHYESADGAMGKAWAEAIKQFEASHPGVKVQFEEKAFEQIRQSAGMILNSDEAPDVMEYNKGNATAGLLSKQGLLTDLTSEAAKRGWDKLLSPSLQTTAKYDERGVMGAGNWYGVPNYAEYVMVYYNKDLFAKHKVEVPKTFDEFTAAMDAFVKADVTPLAVGGAEYPAQQIFYQLALSKAQRPWVDNFQLYKGKVDFHGPEFTYAAETMADWVKKGYIAKDSAAIKAEDMGVSFMGGKYPIVVTGSWWYGRFAGEIKDFEWGSFLWPGNTMSAGSSGNIWVVPENAENKDLAYDFIDITMKKEIQNLLGNSGGVPVAADPAAITDPKSKELIENFTMLSGSDGLAFYPDWPAPGYYDVLVAGVQNLINGSKTPAEVLDELAGPYEENLADIGN